MMPLRLGKIEWRWDTAILILSTWLLSISCTAILVKAIDQRAAATYVAMRDVGAQIAESGRTQKMLVDRLQEMEVRQRVLQDEEAENIQKLRQCRLEVQRLLRRKGE